MSETKTAHRNSDSPAGKVADCDELLARLSKAPDDVGIREKAARACADIGRATESVELLRDHFIHLNAHDWGALPCLCKGCLVADAITAEVEGITFVREFARAEGRILYFWTPLDLASERKQVISSVSSKLRQRLAKAKR